jgi:hypothetical protein
MLLTKQIRRSLLPLAVLALASCAGPHLQWSDRYGRTYDSAGDFLEAAKAVNEQILEELEPLPAPLGGPVTVMIPTREYIETASEEFYTGPESERQHQLVREFVNFQVEYRDYTATMLPRLIERRNIFRSVDVLRIDAVDDVKPPSGGYLLWFEDLNPSDFFHIRASGESDFQTLSDEYMQAKDEFDATRRLLNVIEEYVRSHKPTTS